MVEIGGRPILAHHEDLLGPRNRRLRDCCGYKGEVIKDFFASYSLHMSDVHVDLASQQVTMLRSDAIEPWRVTLVDTGEATMTGGRIKRVAEYIGDRRSAVPMGTASVMSTSRN